MTLDECLQNIEEELEGPFSFSLSVYKNKNHSVKLRVKIREDENGYSLDYIEKILDTLNLVPLIPTAWEIYGDNSIRTTLPSDYKYFFSYHFHGVNN